MRITLSMVAALLLCTTVWAAGPPEPAAVRDVPTSVRPDRTQTRNDFEPHVIACYRAGHACRVDADCCGALGCHSDGRRFRCSRN